MCTNQDLVTMSQRASDKEAKFDFKNSGFFQFSFLSRKYFTRL